MKVLDEHTLAIPDRPGNKIADTFRNLAENNGIGLLFLIPGARETLRVNGRAFPRTNRMSSPGCGPRPEAVLALIVDVEEVYFHCGRALIRSRMWDPASQALAEELPSAGEVATAQLGLDLDPGVMESGLEESYRKLY